MLYIVIDNTFIYDIAEDGFQSLIYNMKTKLFNKQTSLFLLKHEVVLNQVFLNMLKYLSQIYMYI